MGLEKVEFGHEKREPPPRVVVVTSDSNEQGVALPWLIKLLWPLSPSQKLRTKLDIMKSPSTRTNIHHTHFQIDLHVQKRERERERERERLWNKKS